MENLVIKFISPIGRSLLLTDECQLRLELPEGPVIFKVEVQDVGFYNAFTLKSQSLGFEIQKEVLTKMYNSLYLACMEFPISLLLNSDVLSNFVPQKTLDKLTQNHCVNVKSDFNGVQIHHSDTIFVTTLPVSTKSISDLKVFEEKLNKFIKLKYKTCRQIIRAIELLNSSYYLSSINHTARFIILMCAIETLLKPEEVSKRLQLTLETTKKRIKTLKIDPDEKKSILGSLEFLKKSSINRTGTILIERLLDKSKKYNEYSPTDFFKKAYDLRSKFVHSGIEKTKYLSIKNIQLESFVKDLICAYFNQICSNKKNLMTI